MKLKKCISLTIVICLFINIFLFSITAGNIEREDITEKTSRIHFETLSNGRFFLWMQPNVPPPEDGYPVVFLLHGAAQHAFSWIFRWNQWNQNQQSFTIDALNAGFFIVCLESKRPVTPGPRAWDVFDDTFSTNMDFSYINESINWLTNASVQINTEKLFCAGFSSGAFMCSRLALSYSHTFTAMALNSGCNALSITLTSRGPQFNLTAPYDLPLSHPPTLLLHGKRDEILPVQCSENYFQDLQSANISSKLIVSEENGHIWLCNYNKEILNWFYQYL